MSSLGLGATSKPDPSWFLTKQAEEGDSSPVQRCRLCVGLGQGWGHHSVFLISRLGGILYKLPDACPHPSPQILGGRDQDCHGSRM